MSYASVGGIEPWGRNVAETDEVYLWRATFNGANIRNIQDMQAIAAAIGKNQRLGLDLRGVAAEASAPGNTYSVDAAFTSKQHLIYTPGFSNAQDIATRVQAELTERFPGLQISNPHFDQITDDSPKHPALDFWLSHSVIWDIPPGVILPHLETGVPTAAFGRFEGLYRGNAEQGISLKKWPKEQPKPNGNGNGNGNGGASTETAILWVAGAAIVAWLVFRKPTSKGAAR